MVIFIFRIFIYYGIKLFMVNFFIIIYIYIYACMLNTVFKCFGFLDPQILIDMVLERLYEKYYQVFFKDGIQLFMCFCFAVLKKRNKKQGMDFSCSLYCIRNRRNAEEPLSLHLGKLRKAHLFVLDR